MKILGQFKPSRLDVIVIAEELRRWLKERGITPREPQIGVRTDVDTVNACESTPVLLEWHRDVGPNPTDPNAMPAIKQIIAWSNGTPTQLRDMDGTELKSNPYDVVLFDNVRLWHRSPPPENGRWWVGISDPLINE